MGFYTLIGLVAFFGLAFVASAVSADKAILRGFTFMVTKSAVDFFRVRAQEAEIVPDTGQAVLTDVTVNVVQPLSEDPLDVHSNQARVSLAGDALRMEGEVEGWDGKGRRFETDWLEYDQSRGLLFTSAPVILFDAESTIRANGLEYDVQTRALRLTGGTQVQSRRP